MKRILSFVGLLLVIVGMPFVLSVLVGRPHMLRVDLSEVKQTLSGPFLSVDSVIQGLGLLTWLLWAYLFIVASLRVAAIIFVQRGSPTGKALMSVTSRMAPSLLLKVVDVALGSILVLGPISMARAVVPDAAVSLMRASGSAVHVEVGTRSALNGGNHPEVSRSYLVKPGDSLWRIAERELGSGSSWRAIYALNHGRHFPDGRVFDNPRLIRPNWVLWLPGAPEQPSSLPVQSPTAPGPLEAVSSANGHAAPPDQIRLPVAPKAATSSEQHVEPSRDPIVNLPSGAGLAASFASGILASQAVAALRRRRRYLPRGPKVDASEPALVVDLRRARLSPETDHLESAGAELAAIGKEQWGRHPPIVCAIEHRDRATFLIDVGREMELKSTSRVTFTQLETCVRAEVFKPFVPSLDRPSALEEGLLIPIGSTRSGGAVHTGLLAAGALAINGPDHNRLMMQSVLACAVGRSPDDVEIYLLGAPERFGRCVELPHIKRVSSWEDAEATLREIELEILRRSRVFFDEEISDVWERLALDLDEFGPAVLVVASDPPAALTGVLDGIAAQTLNNGFAFLASGWHPSVARIEINVGATIEVTASVPIATEPLRPTLLDDRAIEELIEIIVAAYPQNVEPPEIQTLYEVEATDGVSESSISSEPEAELPASKEQDLDAAEEEEPELEEAPPAPSDGEVHPVAAIRLMDRISTTDERQSGAPVEVRCLGNFLVARADSLVLVGWKARSKELLAYLVAHPDGVSKDRIIDTFWPEAKKQSGDHLLRDAIYHLRKQVAGEGDFKWSESYVTRAGDLIALEPGRWWTDAWTFESLVKIDKIDGKGSVATLRRGLDLYRGDFCDDTYYAWSESIRERYRRLFLDATVKLAELLDVQGEAELAVQALDRGIEVDPLCEELYRRAIKIEASLGRTNAARMRYQKLTTVLADELGEDPDPQTQNLMRGFRNSERYQEPVASQRR